MLSHAQGGLPVHSCARPRKAITIPSRLLIFYKQIMCKTMFFFMCSLLGCAFSASTYDQRQSGDLNVQVDLRDLQIIALTKGGKEEYVDYDYAYDYSEMTIKPHNGTTPKPLNGTSPATGSDKNNTTIPTTIAEQTTVTPHNTSQVMNTFVTWYPAVNDSTTASTTAKILDTTTENSTGFLGDIKNTTTTAPAANTTTCKKGFILNQKGDCEIKLQNTGNALLKLVKLSQKLKLRRENRKGTNST